MMISTAKEFVESFDRLSQAEQLEVAAAILRRATDWNYGELSDEALSRIADQSFQEFDKREAI